MLGDSAPAAEAGLLHPPKQDVDPVLAEERLAAEDHQWHAPVAGGLLVGLAAFDFRIVARRIRRDRRIELGEIEASPRRRAGEVITLVPTLHAPERQHADLVDERQATTAPLRGNPEPLIRLASQLPVADFICQHLSLEETFRRCYGVTAHAAL